MIKIIDSGVIFRNPMPNYKVDQAWEPGLVQLSDQEFLCSFRRGPARDAADCYYAQCRSTDGGKTYVDEGLIWEPEGDDRPYSYVSSYTTLLEDGTLLLAGLRWDRSGPDMYVYNPKTLGSVPCQGVIFRSNDRGHTWTPPEVVVSPEGRTGDPTGRVVPLKDGRLLLAFETWKEYDDPGLANQASLMFFSSDGGHTWDDYAVAVQDPEGRLVYWNGMPTRLQDGRIYVMYWVKDYISDEDFNVRATWSEDEGRTWIDVFDTGIVGQPGCSIDIGGGRVLAAYSRREADRPGIYVTISEDGGRTWPSFEEHVAIWDAGGGPITGSDVSKEERAREVDFDGGVMDFSKPDALLLPNGDAYIGFWATIGIVQHLRWCRLRVS